MGTAFSFCLRYRIHVSFLFLLSQAAGASRLEGVRLPWIVMISFSCWMSSAYLFNRLTDQVEDRISQSTEVLESLVERRIVFGASLFFLLAPGLWMAFSNLNCLPYFCLSPLAWLYSLNLPIIGKPKKLLFFKNLYSSVLGWALPIGVEIIYYGQSEVPIYKLIPICAEVAGLTTIFELLWDIRDMDGDRLAGVYTVANTFGVEITKVLAFIILASVLWLKIKLNPEGLISTSLFFGSVIFLAREGLSKVFYHGIILLFIVMLCPNIFSKIING